MPSAEDQLKERFNLRYAAASKLVQDARTVLGNDADDEAVLAEAVQNYQQLDPSEQQALTATTTTAASEPAWQQKARQAAEKREAEWQESSKNSNTAPTTPAPEPLPPNVKKQIVTTRVGNAEPQVHTTTQEVAIPPPNDDNTTTTRCYCVIL